MAELLLELFSEEIPARMQARGADELKRLVCEGLKAAGLEFTEARAYATPRRLALHIDGLPDKQPDVTEEKKGPKVGAPEQALAGFMKANGLASIGEAELRKTDKGEFYFAVRHVKGRPTKDVLSGSIAEVLRAFVWPKSMRWADYKFRWIRPMHNILCVSEGQVVNVVFGLVTSRIGEIDAEGSESVGHLSYALSISNGNVTNTTRGHRFLAPEPFEISSFADYEEKLRAAKVVLDREERKKIISEGAAKLAKAEGLTVKNDPALLDEVTGLVEWPVVLIGGIDADFMDLPPEVLTTAMRSHQKYFTLLNEDGSMAPRFALVSNMETADGGVQITAGNERVLRARLSDARFFWDQDRKQTLSSRTTQLADITFHAKLGTLDAKVDRMQALAVEIAKHIDGADRDHVRAAARLAKADLVTGMVGEFPELQGLMGRYYALADGEHEAVADAIRDHYAPQGPNDDCPSAPVSVAVALADKIDTLVGFWAIDEKPTGSKDPYALRRAALGVIRLVIENGLRVNLRPVFETGFDDYPATVTEGAEKGPVCADLLSFFADRIAVHLKGQGVRHDLIAAVFALGGEDDPVRLLARVEALQGFIESDDGANLLTAFRRAANILRIEEKKDGVSHGGKPDKGGFVQDEEAALGRALKAASAAVARAVKQEEFTSAMAALAALRGPVDEFFDAVTVNAEDADLRVNRLRLLSQIRATMGLIADFSQIEG